MRISEMLHSIASWLENPDNEAILLSEYHEDSLKIVAESCVQAAYLLKIAATEVEVIEPPQESKITPESIEELGNLASALDESGDEKLRKQAAVLDELLLTLAAPPNMLSNIKEAEESKIDELKRKYENPSIRLRESNKIADSEKAVNDSGMTRQYRILEAPLNTRYCPDHPGAQIARVGESMWQCDLDKKTYNFATGFELNNGSKVPGGEVSQQNQAPEINNNSVFDNREGRLISNVLG